MVTGGDLFGVTEQLKRIADALEKLAAPLPVEAALLPDPCGVKEYIGDGVYVTCKLPPNHPGRHQSERVGAPPRVWPK